MTNTEEAQNEITKIKAKKMNFMGNEVQKYNYAIEIREQLQKKAERGLITPMVMLQAFKLTYKNMSTSEKRCELSD